MLAAVTAAPASAMISKQDLNTALNSATASGNVSGVINGDTVTLFGVVESRYDVDQARQAALKNDGVNKVISLVSTTR
ncbi:MAG: BON domain-containing protein [Granulosicoccaceae bacterium]